MDRDDPFARAIRDVTERDGDATVYVDGRAFKLRSWTLYKDTATMSMSWIDVAADLKELERLTCR